MHQFQSGLRNMSSQKNFRQGGDSQNQQGSLIEELRQREKVYLDVICDLTNRNRELEQQSRMYEQHCQLLEEELRKRDNASNSSVSRNRSSSSEKNLFRSFSGKLTEAEPERQPVEALRKEIEQVDETPELANNSSRFVERMALILDSNFGDGCQKEEKKMDEIPEVGSTKTESLSSQNENMGRTAESIRLIQPDAAFDFSSKNTQIRNVYTVSKEESERPVQTPFTKTSYRPLQMTTNNFQLASTSNGQTSRKFKDGLDPTSVRQSNLHNFHRPTDDKQNALQPRQNIHSIFAQASNMKPSLQQQIFRPNNRSLTHKEYLKQPGEPATLSGGNLFHTSSHASLASYQTSANSNCNSQLRIGTHF